MKDTGDNEILEELRRITKLLALNATKGQSQQEQVGTLSNIGFRPIEVAELLGIKYNIVTAVLANIKKKSKSKEAKAQKTE